MAEHFISRLVPNGFASPSFLVSFQAWSQIWLDNRRSRSDVSAPSIPRSFPRRRMSSAELARWFSEQVQPHEPALRAYLLKRFPTLPDHDDLIQDSYSRLLRAHENGRLTHARAFLFTTARNAAIDLVRRRGVKPTETLAEDDVCSVLDEPIGVRESLERQQQLDAVVEAVMELPERCRAVVLLRYFDGLSSAQIAAQLGITPETVRVQMFKGVQHCIAFFAERGLLDPQPPQASR